MHSRLFPGNLPVLPDALGIPDISGGVYIAVLYRTIYAQENVVSLNSEHDLTYDHHHLAQMSKIWGRISTTNNNDKWQDDTPEEKRVYNEYPQMKIRLEATSHGSYKWML